MDKQNILKILDIKPMRGDSIASAEIPRRAADIMRTIREEPEEVDDRFKMLEFLNSLSNRQG